MFRTLRERLIQNVFIFFTLILGTFSRIACLNFAINLILNMMKMTTTRISSLLMGFLLVLLGTSVQGQVLQENFDGGTFPPAGWVTADNGIGTGVNWVSSTTSFAGAGAAFCTYDCSVATSAEDWLITPQVTPTAGNSTLSYYHRQTFATAYGSVYEVRVSTTSQTNLASFVTVDSIGESSVPVGAYGIYGVDLSAYNGVPIYIAFVHTNICGDDYYIDELTLGASPCLPVTGLAAANITANSADLTWTTTGSVSNVAVVPAGAAPVGGALSTTGAYTATGLAGASDYDVYVRNVCEGGAPLIVSGVFDGPLSGGQPKVIELYVQDSISDLSAFSVGSTNNGTGTTAPNGEFTFPAVPASAGSYIHITSDSADFVTYFGSSADYVDGVAFINGDDGIEVISNGAVIDIFGQDSVDGTGAVWEYLDGWALRKPGVAANGGVFVDSNWVYSSPNAVDGCTANSTCASVFPIETYMGAFNASPWVGPISFQTLCPGPIQAPWMEAFDGTSTPGCWTESGAQSWIYNTNAAYAAATAGDHTGNGGNYLWQDGSLNDDGDTSVIESPFIIVDSMTTPELGYWIFSNNTDDTLQYNEFIAEFWDGAAWTTVQTFKGDLAPNWVETIVPIDTFNITGPVQVRFTIIGEFGSSFYNDILIDDVNIREAPTCPNPTAFVVDSITESSASVNFTAPMASDTFYYWLVPAGTAPVGPPSATTTLPVPFTGLAANTAYDFIVQVYCGVNDSSEVRGTTFTTLCPAVVPGDSASVAIPVGLPFSTMDNSECNTNQIGNTAPDVFYSVTVSACADSLLVSSCGSGFDTYLRILDDTLAPVALNDDNGPLCSGAQASIAIPVTAGATYYIVLEGFGTNAGNYNLDITEVQTNAPDPSFSYASGSICEGTMAMLPVVTGDSNGVFTATGGLAIDSLTGSFIPATAGSYVVSYTVDNGSCALTDTFGVTVNANDDASFSYASDSLCSAPDSASATIAGTAGGVFTATSGLVFTGSNGAIDLAASTPGTYAITYMTNGVCAAMETDTITIVETIDAAFTYATDTFCMGDTINPSAAATNMGGTFSTTTGLTVNATTGELDLMTASLGTYVVTYDFGGLCATSASYTVTIVDCSVGLYGGLEDLSVYQVFPNPNTGLFKVVNQGVDKDLDLQVVDLQGKLIFNERASLIQGQPYTIDLGEIAAGTYFLRVVDGAKTANYKIAVDRN